MSAPAIGIRPRVLPPTSARVNQSHPLGVGMLAAMAPARGVCLATGRPLTTAASNTSLRSTSWGPAGQVTANNAQGYSLAIGTWPTTGMSWLIVADKLTGTSSRSGLVVFDVTSAATESNTGGVSIGYGNSGNNGWDASTGANGSTHFALHHGVAWRQLTQSIPDGPVTLGGYRTVAGTGLLGYVNGVPSSAGGVSTGSVPTGSTLWAIIGVGAVSRSAGADRCPISALLVWNRILTDRDFASLHADPFQMFRY